jgi:CRISPR system Cascade subunit CasA
LKSFNLIHEKWIPVKRVSGEFELIAPSEITSRHDTDPIGAFAWPRPDFDLASHEILIGLLAAIFPADPREPKQWVKLFHQPPSPDELAATLERFADAFVLDGDGPRFLQDFDKLDGEELPVDELLMDTPGEDTDLFVKRVPLQVLSRSAAAIALYTLQQFAPEGGRGHNTSMRGGGPLVTMLLPPSKAKDDETILKPKKDYSLWQTLWLNTPGDRKLVETNIPLAFPWCAPTIVASKGKTVSEAAAHPLQAFFGMPWRIRLIFKPNVERKRCGLTGKLDEVIVTGFIRRPYGVKYGVWRHPLTPYRFPKLKPLDRAAVHGSKGRLGYRQWLGAVYRSTDSSGRVGEPAGAVTLALSRLLDLKINASEQARLFAAGYAMKQRKALAFAEAEMPVHVVSSAALAEELSQLATRLVDAASVAASILSMALRLALFGSKTEVKADQTVLATPREILWETTEDAFHQTLDTALTSLADDLQGDEQEKLARAWRDALEGAALNIFDDIAPVDSLGKLEPKNVVEGRRRLALSLKGYGTFGAVFFKALWLDPPEPKKKPSRTSKMKDKEAIL